MRSMPTLFLSHGAPDLLLWDQYGNLGMSCYAFGDPETFPV
jgi:hypothetical protein